MHEKTNYYKCAAYLQFYTYRVRIYNIRFSGVDKCNQCANINSEWNKPLYWEKEYVDHEAVWHPIHHFQRCSI